MQVDCALLRKQEDLTIRPIGYWSRPLNDARSAHDTTYHQFYSVLWAVLLLQPYSERTKFTIQTDRDSLKLILYLAHAIGVLALWQLCSSKLNFDSIDRDGMKNEDADALPRLEPGGEDYADIHKDILVALLTLLKT